MGPKELEAIVQMALDEARNKGVDHIEMLHTITQDNMVGLMDRYAGRDWEKQYDELAAIRARQEQIVLDEQPHGMWDGNTVWAGVRRTDEHASAAGFYGLFANRDGQTSLQFRPILPDIDHQEAEIAAEYLKERLKADARDIEQDNNRHPTIAPHL